jgi:hypothetical protein
VAAVGGAARGVLLPRGDERSLRSSPAGYGQVLTVAARVLAQDRYLASRLPHAQETHLLGCPGAGRVPPVIKVR